MTFSLLTLAGFVVALASVVILTPTVRRFAFAAGWVDTPDGNRKLHRTATPSIGGVAIFGSVLIGVASIRLLSDGAGLPGRVLPPSVYLGAIAMVGLGFFDDIRGMGFRSKLLLQVAIAVGVVWGGLRLDLSGIPVLGGGVPNAWWVPLLTVFWIVGIANAINLIDGVDGLAAGTVAIAFVCLAIVYGLAGDLSLVILAAVFAGALGGFLVYNLSPATIFMGDSGSLFLGYAVAVYSIARFGQDPITFAPAVPLLALGLPILDTALSMGRRLVNRRPVFSADRDHIHHRMVDRMPTRKAVWVLYAIAASFGVLAVASSSFSWTGLWIAVVVATLIILVLLLRLGYVRMPYTPPQLAALSPLPVTREHGEDRLVTHTGDGAAGPLDCDLVTDSAESL